MFTSSYINNIAIYIEECNIVKNITILQYTINIIFL